METIFDKFRDSEKAKAGTQRKKAKSAEKRNSTLRITALDFSFNLLRSACVSQIQNATPKILPMTNAPGRTSAVIPNIMLLTVT